MLDLVLQEGAPRPFIDLGANWALVRKLDFVEHSGEPAQRARYAFWNPNCMDGVRPGYIA